MAKEIAIVMNDGGLNAAVATALAAQKSRVVLVFVDTADKAAKPARAAFNAQASHFKPYRDHALSMPFWADLGPGVDPAAAMSDPRRVAPVGPKLVDLLPLFAAAARFASHYGATSIHCGLRVGPAGEPLAVATEYGQIWSELLQVPCNKPDLTVEMPLLELDAWQVVDVGSQVSAPFDRTWTCAEPGPDPCWACRPCRAREAAFQQAAKPDPLRVLRKV